MNESSSVELTASRLDWIHGQFLQAASDFPRIWHALLRCEDARHNRLFLHPFSWTNETPLFLPHANPKTPTDLIDDFVSSIGDGGPATRSHFTTASITVSDHQEIAVFWSSSERSDLYEAFRRSEWIVSRLEPTLEPSEGFVFNYHNRWCERVHSLLHSTEITFPVQTVDGPPWSRVHTQHFGVEWFISCAMAVEALAKRIRATGLDRIFQSEAHTPTSREEPELQKMQVDILAVVASNPGLSRKGIAGSVSKVQNVTIQEQAIAKPLAELRRHKIVRHTGEGFQITPWGLLVLKFNLQRSAAPEEEDE